MAISKKHWLLFWIYLQPPTAWCNFRTKYFDIEKNTVILNNYLDICYESKNLIRCGIKCVEHVDCTAATYQNVTSACKLHFYNNSHPLITKYNGGITTITIKGYRRPVNMTFDIDTLHPDLYVSTDKTILSTRISDKVTAWPPGSNQLTNYPGVIASYCVASGQKLYYDFYYEYELLEARPYVLIAIEFGIADKATVDNHVYCGDVSVDGWSFPINECFNTKLCLEAWRQNTGYLETPISDNVAGTYKSGTFAVIVDRVDNTFSLFDKETLTLIYSFTDVISSASLCPAFSTDPAVNASITILSSLYIE